MIIKAFLRFPFYLCVFLLTEYVYGRSVYRGVKQVSESHFLNSDILRKERNQVIYDAPALVLLLREMVYNGRKRRNNVSYNTSQSKSSIHHPQSDGSGDYVTSENAHKDLKLNVHLASRDKVLEAFSQAVPPSGTPDEKVQTVYHGSHLGTRISNLDDNLLLKLSDKFNRQERNSLGVDPPDNDSRHHTKRIFRHNRHVRDTSHVSSPSDSPGDNAEAESSENRQGDVSQIDSFGDRHNRTSQTDSPGNEESDVFQTEPSENRQDRNSQAGPSGPTQGDSSRAEPPGDNLPDQTVHHERHEHDAVGGNLTPTVSVQVTVVASSPSDRDDGRVDTELQGEDSSENDSHRVQQPLISDEAEGGESTETTDSEADFDVIGGDHRGEGVDYPEISDQGTDYSSSEAEEAHHEASVDEEHDDGHAGQNVIDTGGVSNIDTDHDTGNTQAEADEYVSPAIVEEGNPFNATLKDSDTPSENGASSSSTFQSGAGGANGQSGVDAHDGSTVNGADNDVHSMDGHNLTGADESSPEQASPVAAAGRKSDSTSLDNNSTSSEENASSALGISVNVTAQSGNSDLDASDTQSLTETYGASNHVSSPSFHEGSPITTTAAAFPLTPHSQPPELQARDETTDGLPMETTAASRLGSAVSTTSHVPEDTRGPVLVSGHPDIHDDVPPVQEVTNRPTVPSTRLTTSDVAEYPSSQSQRETRIPGLVSDQPDIHDDTPAHEVMDTPTVPPTRPTTTNVEILSSSRVPEDTRGPALVSAQPDIQDDTPTHEVVDRPTVPPVSPTTADVTVSSSSSQVPRDTRRPELVSEQPDIHNHVPVQETTNRPTVPPTRPITTNSAVSSSSRAPQDTRGPVHVSEGPNVHDHVSVQEVTNRPTALPTRPTTSDVAVSPPSQEPGITREHPDIDESTPVHEVVDRPTAPPTRPPATTDGAATPSPPVSASLAPQDTAHGNNGGATPGPLNVPTSEPPAAFLELQLEMSWADFCTYRGTILGDLVIVLKEESTLSQLTSDQIYFLDGHEGFCQGTVTTDMGIMVRLYFMNKRHRFDMQLTQKCYQFLHNEPDLTGTFMLHEKLSGVSYHEEQVSEPTHGEGASGADGGGKAGLENPETGEGKGEGSGGGGRNGGEANGEGKGQDGSKGSNFFSEPGVLVALVLACIGVVSCVGMVAVQIAVRRRKQMRKILNGTMKRSASITSADSIQLAEVTKSRPNSGLFNPAMDITDSVGFKESAVMSYEKLLEPSHHMNFAQLADFCSDESKVVAEFEKLPNRMPRLSVVPTGEEDKNRFANVLPLALTRVKLLQDGPDHRSSYINANYITGPDSQCQYYIATQAPTEDTIADFWTMIWQQGTRAIVMLTQMEEDGQQKCTPYWPDFVGKSAAQKHGDFLIELKNKDVCQEYIASELEIRHMRKTESRPIFHFWYTCWPTKSLPEPISLIKLVLDSRTKYEDAGVPLVVHCSPGTGRTGTFIALDQCMHQFETRRTVDVMKTVYSLRQERAGAVQSKEQYTLLYQAAREYASIIESPGISAASSATTLHALLPSS